MITSLYAYTLLRARAIADENVPGRGAVILAPNHFSFMDHFLMGCYLRRKVRFMAKSILRQGGAITMYCEGGRSRTGKVAEQAKRGIGRLALETGAPVVPIAIHGSSRIRNWKRLQFPKVTIQYGEPIRWEQIRDSTREQQQDVADQILTEIRRLYAGLEE